MTPSIMESRSRAIPTFIFRGRKSHRFVLSVSLSLCLSVSLSLCLSVSLSFICLSLSLSLSLFLSLPFFSLTFFRVECHVFRRRFVCYLVVVVGSHLLVSSQKCHHKLVASRHFILQLLRPVFYISYFSFCWRTKKRSYFLFRSALRSILFYFTLPFVKPGLIQSLLAIPIQSPLKYLQPPPIAKLLQSPQITFIHLHPSSSIFNHLQSPSITSNHLQSPPSIFNHLQSPSTPVGNGRK